MVHRRFPALFPKMAAVEEEDSLETQVAALWSGNEGVGGLWMAWDATALRKGRDGSGGSPADGEVVGFVLDRQYMAGTTAATYLAGLTEDIANGNFASGDLTSWTDSSTGTGSATYSSGTCALVGTDASNEGSIEQAHDASSGDWVRVRVTTVVTSGGIDVTVGGQSASITTSGNHEFFFDLSSAANLKFTTASGGGNVTVDDISLTAVPGNHLVAESDAARPLWQEDTYSYFDGDQIDDVLRRTYASAVAQPFTVACAWRSPGNKIPLDGATQNNRSLWTTSTDGNLRFLTLSGGAKSMTATGGWTHGADEAGVFTANGASSTIYGSGNSLTGDQGTNTADGMTLLGSGAPTNIETDRVYMALDVPIAPTTVQRDLIASLLTEQSGVSIP